jgi:hypothetical protein
MLLEGMSYCFLKCVYYNFVWYLIEIASEQKRLWRRITSLSKANIILMSCKKNKVLGWHEIAKLCCFGLPLLSVNIHKIYLAMLYNTYV